jgi:hypothetical protein
MRTALVNACLGPLHGRIHSRRFLGAKLKVALESAHANRTGHHFYVSINEGAGNATFANELTAFHYPSSIALADVCLQEGTTDFAIRPWSYPNGPQRP